MEGKASSLCSRPDTLVTLQGAEEAAALSKPRFSGSKSAEFEELKSHHTTPRQLCGDGLKTELGNAAALYSRKAQLCKVL